MTDKEILIKAIEKIEKADPKYCRFLVKTTTKEEWDDLMADNGYYAIIFSHAFASEFWKDRKSRGYYNYCEKDGYLKEIPRLKDSDRYCILCGKEVIGKEKFENDSWIDQIREMACEENPLQYIKRFL